MRETEGSLHAVMDALSGTDGSNVILPVFVTSGVRVRLRVRVRVRVSTDGSNVFVTSRVLRDCCLASSVLSVLPYDAYLRRVAHVRRMEGGWRADGGWMEGGWRVDGGWMEGG